eukprot:UC1_evm2s912
MSYATSRAAAVLRKAAITTTLSILFLALFNGGASATSANDPTDWLVRAPAKPVELVPGSVAGVPTLTLQNGLLKRTWALPPSHASNVTGFGCISLIREGHTGRESPEAMEMLRAVEPEARLTLDGQVYDVGGLVGQPDLSFLNKTWIKDQMTAAEDGFVYVSHRTRAPVARYTWTPGERFSDKLAAWPPRGLVLDIDFVLASPPPPPPPPPPPTSSSSSLPLPPRPSPQLPSSHRDVLVTVSYALYAGIPAYEKWVTVRYKGSSSVVVIDALAIDILAVTPEAAGAAHGTVVGDVVIDGSWVGSATTGRVRLQSEMSRGPSFMSMAKDPKCNTCARGGVLLTSAYPLGPGAELGVSGFHGEKFNSVRSLTLLHDSDNKERQGLAIRRMYRTLAPQTTENPVFMHLTDTSPSGVRDAVDQCVAVGFEMIIFSFGTSFDMENKDPDVIAEWTKSIAYAHRHNISVGGYNLMSSSRTVPEGGNCVDPDGKPIGASCLASEWSDDYFRTIKHFIEATELDAIETDGPFEGSTCASTNHTHHKGYNDSLWTQYERNMDFYAWCRARGMYIHAPDPYYFRGINKDGMGYVETNWNLPLWEQITLARQNVFDGTFERLPSQGWMFVPIAQYHGGWPECCIEPAGFLGGQWESYLQLYFGSGVSPCYRGPRLYDPSVLAGAALVKKYTDWNNAYRTILHADIIHLVRAGSGSPDALLHVQPDPARGSERAMLVVYNQSPMPVNITIRAPLYYSGLSTTARVSHEGNTAIVQRLSRDYTLDIEVGLAPTSFTWYVFEE